MRPKRDFGFSSRSESQPGTRLVLPGAGDREGGDDLRLDDRLELRHQLARTRGSRTKLRRSMMKFAAITANANTSSSPCVSG